MRKATEGYTLVEVLVAMLIFSIAMLYGLSFFVYGQKHMANAKEVTFSLQMAKDGIETVKAMQYDAVKNIPPTTANEMGKSFKRDMSIDEIYTATEKYKVVSATVTWTSNGQKRQVFLHTIVAPGS